MLLGAVTSVPMLSPNGAFPFWRDPVCVSSWALYALNRAVLAPHFATQIPFLRAHFNDSLLIPAALPVLIWARGVLNLRNENGPPTWREIAFWLLIWSLIFEFLGPKWIGHSVGDWRDVLAYVLGALVAGAIWNGRRVKIEV